MIITEKALLPFLLAGEEIYILCYFTSRETESRPGALRSWLTLDGCELFGAEEIKYPSFWSLWPQQSIFVVEFFFWFAGFSLSFHVSPPDVINVLFEQAAAVTSPS